VGAVQAPSNLDEAAFNKLVEVYFTDSHDRVTFKAGRLYADADFNAVETAGDFLNASYGLIPTILMPTYPTPQVGVSVWTKINSRVSIGAGFYDGSDLIAPEESQSPVSAGLFMIAEVKVEPFSKQSKIRGSYHFGVWQQGNGAWKTGDAISPARNYGLYATGEHWFGKRLSGGGNLGPGVFFQVGWSPSDRNDVPMYWGVGTAYAGLLRQRPHDSVGVGVTQTRLQTGSETALEMFYRVQATKEVFIQPDMQWVTKPFGNGSNALLAGLRLGISF
jgi:carbohydrate-selective porin OprB